MLGRTTFALMALGYCVCIAVALVDQQYFQASVFFIVAALHTLGRFDVDRPDRIDNRDSTQVVQLSILYLGLALAIYLALRKP